MELLELILIPELEWIDPAEHLIDHETERPPVHCLVVPGALDDFRREIFRCSTESVGHLVTRHLELTKTEVSELDVPVRVEYYILWL